MKLTFDPFYERRFFFVTDWVFFSFFSQKSKIINYVL